MNTLIQRVELINTKSKKTFSSSVVETGLTQEQVEGIENLLIKGGLGINDPKDANVKGDYVILYDLKIVGEEALSKSATYAFETSREAYAFVEGLLKVGLEANKLS